MPRRSEHYKDKQRSDILDAARRCFLRNGFHHTSIREVIAETGRSAGAVYRYFPSKDDMILAIATQNLADVTALLHSAIREGGSAPQPTTVMASLLTQVAARDSADQLATVALMVWSEALRNAGLAHKLREANSSMTRDLSDVIRQTQTPDVARHTSPEQTAQVMLAVLPGYLLTLALLDPSAASYFPEIAVNGLTWKAAQTQLL